MRLIKGDQKIGGQGAPDRRRLFGAVLLICAVLWLGWLPNARAQTVVHVEDFSGQADGDAADWLKNNGFELRLGAKKLNPHFEGGRLVLETDREEAGLFNKPVEIPNVSKLRIHWGVERYPRGADWDNGNFRVPIAVMISLGREKLDSGSIVVPDAPYFLGVFLGEKEKEGHAYTAKYYKKGGRYYCVPCGAAASDEVLVTEFDLETAFKTEFQQEDIPAVAQFGFQMNTEDTQGGARAFLVKVEFLSDG